LIPAHRGAALVCALGLWPGVAWAAPLSPDDVVRSALSRHPDAVASASAVSAADAGRRAIGLFLDDPQASVAFAGGELQGSLVQPLSVTGEGWHARSAARAGLDAAQDGARRARLRVAAEARAAYAWAVTTREGWRLADEALQQATGLRAAVEAREAVGEARPLDVRLARMAEAEAAQRAIRARRDEADAITSLALYTPDAGAELLDDPLAAVPAAGGSAGRSDVAAAEGRLREAEAALRRERAAAVPAIGLGVFVQGPDVGPQVNVGVPLWTRNRAAIGAARADLDVARAAVETVRGRAAAEQDVLPAVGAYADEALGRLGDFEQDARAALASIEAGWSTGEIALAEAVLLRREVLDGWAAALAARQDAVEARLQVLLATEDPHLVPEDRP
jgi:outer membrane protein, heavy metal efflux system